MDNLGSHKGKAVRQAIRSAGPKQFFLPKYSPDLNPIEQVFAKLKHLTSVPRSAAHDGDASRKQAHTNGEGAVAKTFRVSRLMADVAILDDGLAHQQRELALTALWAFRRRGRWTPFFLLVDIFW
jgi:hypothetical protein